MPSTKIFIILFICIIFFPVTQQKIGLLRYDPIEENRIKLNQPKGNMLHKLLEKGTTYSKKYEQYYNDTYGFRDNFIRLKNQVDYSVFGLSDELLIGRDNWLFYRNVVENEEVMIENISDTDFYKIQNGLLRINNELKKKGITFVVMVLPMKNTIYPELNLNNTVVRPKKTKFLTLLENLKSNPDIHIIDGYSILNRYKHTYQLFHKTDFHWNNVGAYFVSKYIVDSLANWIHSPIVWDYPLDLQYIDNYSGGQNNSLALFRNPLERDVSVKIPSKYASSSLPVTKPLEFHYKSKYENEKTLLPNTVFIGNSFLLNLSNTGFYDYFSEVKVLHSSNISLLPSVLRKYKAKIVIFQILEVDLLKSFLFN